MSKLTHRFGLTFLSNLLLQGSYLLIGLVVTPVIIRGLGAELYGAWQMIEQAIQYLARSDLRPMGTLRVFLAVRQHDDDHLEKKRLVGAALLITFAMLLPILIVGMILVWKSPSFIRVSKESVWAVQLTMAIAVLRVALDKLLGLPGSVLSGLNLEYKAMGLNAATVLLGGVISITAIKAGLGLPGAACAAVVGVTISGGVRFLIARRYVPWFGVARPTRKELVVFGKSSCWYFLSSIADAFLNVSDLLIVGIVMGPKSAAVYATTGAVLRMSAAPIANMVGSASSGIGELCGRNDWERVSSVRSEMHILSMAVMTIVGVGILSLNNVFLHRWVGAGFYGGNILNLLLVLIAILNALVATDSMLVDNLLVFREKGMAMLLCGLFTLGAGATLSRFLGAPGMAIAVLASHLWLFLYFHKLIKQKIPIAITFFTGAFSRLLIVAISLFFFAYNLSGFVTATTWFTIGLSGCAVVVITSGTIWIFGLTSNYKSAIISRFSTYLPL